MASAMEIVNRNVLRCLIKQVSDKGGGDDPEWLKDYTEEVLARWSKDLDRGIECFRSLLE